MRVLLVALLACLATSSCRTRRVTTYSAPSRVVGPSTLISGDFITKNGNYSHGDASTTHELQLDHQGKRVQWTHSVHHHSASGSGGGSSSTSMNLKSPADPWFVYVESPERLWFFNGTDNLFCRYVVGSSTKAANVIQGGSFQPTGESIPVEVVARLPAELQKIVPAPETKRRPSI